LITVTARTSPTCRIAICVGQPESAGVDSHLVDQSLWVPDRVRDDRKAGGVDLGLPYFSIALKARLPEALEDPATHRSRQSITL